MEQRDIIQRMPANDQIHITKKTKSDIHRFIFIILFFFAVNVLALDEFKMLIGVDRLT